MLGRLGECLNRDAQDRMAGEGCLPSGRRWVTVQGARGWLFPLATEAGDAFRLFLWFDGASYQVKVVDPDVSGDDPHACHLFPEGRICMGRAHGGGMPTLEDAYAKAVLWANGFGAYRRTGRFPF